MDHSGHIHLNEIVFVELLPSFEAIFWLSLFAAPLGAFLIYRRLSFLGDALGHASMAGIAVMVLLVGQNAWLMSAGALTSVLVTTGILRLLERGMKMPSDVAMTVSYSGMFALGLVLLGHESHELEHILFGDIVGVGGPMLWFLRIWGSIALGLIIFLWKPLWASIVDPIFAKTVGYPVGKIDYLFLVLISVSIVGVIQSVGIILVAAYLVIPGAAMVPWTRSLRGLVLGAGCFAFLQGMVGLGIASSLHSETGPTIALCGFSLMLLSHFTRWVAR